MAYEWGVDATCWTETTFNNAFTVNYQPHSCLCKRSNCLQSYIQVIIFTALLTLSQIVSIWLFWMVSDIVRSSPHYILVLICGILDCDCLEKCPHRIRYYYFDPCWFQGLALTILTMRCTFWSYKQSSDLVRVLF